MSAPWESKFPHPGTAPEQPPAGTLDPALVYPYNKWVSAMRKHNVAKAVDSLIRQEQMAPLDAVETIALTVGVMLLDGSIRESSGALFGAFGMFE